MPEKRIAQYKQIENDLLQKINLGYYKKDDLIPTEFELSNTYGVSRVTVRKATDNLVARGLLKRVAGVGTFVCHSSVTLNPSTIQGFSETMTNQGISVRTEVPTFMLMNAPANISSILRIEAHVMGRHGQISPLLLGVLLIRPAKRLPETPIIDSFR